MIGIGIDAVDVGRFDAVLRRTPGVADRLFTVGEQRDAGGAPERLAARFAAKEAAMKALGVGIGAIDFHDVEVVRAASGAPNLVVSGRAAALAGERRVSAWLVSLTHTDTVASAVVVAT